MPSSSSPTSPQSQEPQAQAQAQAQSPKADPQQQKPPLLLNELDWIRPDCLDFFHTELQSKNADRIKTRASLLRYGVTRAYALKKRYPNVSCQFLEFGVHEGRDIRQIASYLASLDSMSQRRKSKSRKDGAATTTSTTTTTTATTKTKTKTTIHGFDSFEGLPEDWKNGQYLENNGATALKFQAGAFDVKGETPRVEDQLKNEITFHKGWFDETVAAFFNDQQPHSPPIAFCHADADLYSSTKSFLDEIGDRKLLRKGSIIVFDEFWNYPNWQEGEYKAWCEMVATFDIQFSYLAYHGPRYGLTDPSALGYYGYQSVCVLILKDM